MGRLFKPTFSHNKPQYVFFFRFGLIKEAEAIGRAGREYVLKNHMPVNRVDYILRTILKDKQFGKNLRELMGPYPNEEEFTNLIEKI